uniref:Uncharacterized protein n=1 Tax=Romanomermis culicivorax TaxID=13658 RepID=A0A915K6A6_ROMCU
SPKFEQFYALLDNNLNLERLDIFYVSVNNLELIEKLMRFPKLKTLSLDISDVEADLDEDLPYHTVIKDLHFVSLQNIEVFCGNFESHAKFVAFLLSRSQLLKKLSLRPSH